MNMIWYSSSVKWQPVFSVWATVTKFGMLTDLERDTFTFQIQNHPQSKSLNAACSLAKFTEIAVFSFLSFYWGGHITKCCVRLSILPVRAASPLQIRWKDSRCSCYFRTESSKVEITESHNSAQTSERAATPSKSIHINKLQRKRRWSAQ